MNYKHGTQKSPVITEILSSYTISSVSSESLSFFTQAGAADAGEAAGTVVIAKLAKSPVLNLFGDRLGEYSGSALSTSISFSTGVMDSTLECGFIMDGDLNQRITKTVASMATKSNGAWACDYLTGLIIVKKKTTGTSQTITSYKVRRPYDSSAGSQTPNIDSYSSVPINLAAGSNQSIISAPGASKQIWVYGYQLTVNAAGTIAFQDEDDTALSGVMPLDKGIAVAPSGNFAQPLFKVATNKALEMDIVTSEVDGTLQYAVVSV